MPDATEALADVQRALRVHRRNEVIEPTADLPIRTRVKCDSDECDFFEVHDRWHEAVAAHETHVAAALSAHLAERDAARDRETAARAWDEGFRARTGGRAADWRNPYRAASGGGDR